MNADSSPSLDLLRQAILEAITNSEVCRALEALAERGWNPSVSIDITLEPAVGTEPAGTEPEARATEVAPSDDEFLNSVGIVTGPAER